MSVTINGTNGLTFNDNSTQTTAATGFGFKNRIINGAMMIDQRNAGASVTVNSATATFGVDRFYSTVNGGAFTLQRDTTVPNNYFQYSTKITITTANSSVDAGEYAAWHQAIEGLNCYDLGWGTSTAETVALSFWVRASVTGTYNVALVNINGSRCYPCEFTISAANTWQQVKLSIPGCPDGTWSKDNTTSIVMRFSLGDNTQYNGTVNTWNSSSNAYVGIATAGAVRLIQTLNATMYITGVQLEKGSTATSFDYRPYGTELALCQRYYAKSYNQTTVPGSNAGTTNSVQGLNGTDGNQIQGFRTPVTMRATATARVWSLSGSLATLSTTGEVNSGVGAGSWNPYGMGDQGCRAIVGNSGLTSGTAYVYHWDASAEL